MRIISLILCFNANFVVFQKMFHLFLHISCHCTLLFSIFSLSFSNFNLNNCHNDTMNILSGEQERLSYIPNICAYCVHTYITHSMTLGSKNRAYNRQWKLWNPVRIHVTIVCIIIKIEQQICHSKAIFTALCKECGYNLKTIILEKEF